MIVDEYKSIGTHFIAFYMNGDTVTCLIALELKISRKKKSIGNKNVKTNIYRIQVIDLIMLKYFCIGLIDSMLKGKSLLNYTNLFSPNDYEKNDKIILNNFQQLNFSFRNRF